MEDKKFDLIVKSNGESGFSLDVEINAMSYNESMKYLAAYVTAVCKQMSEVWKKDYKEVLCNVDSMLKVIAEKEDDSFVVRTNKKSDKIIKRANEISVKGEIN